MRIVTPIVPSLANLLITVYQHRLNDQCLYVGCCKLTDLMNSPDARQNTEWKRIVIPGLVLELETLNITVLLDEAKQFHQDHILRLRPWCNLNGKTIDGNSARVQCVETGVEYASASDAARANYVTPGSMSNHLNGRKGYNTVRGFTFRRV